MTLDQAIAVWLVYSGLGPDAETNDIRDHAWQVIRHHAEQAVAKDRAERHLQHPHKDSQP